ncbi:YbeD family protein [Salinisphaera orenii]|uniref:UPF0250 protein SAHL_15050 n=1 Tax=Salinisphaera orenii YIM 95161 TaxID=1051139 RepID=A0A423PHI3_9GAMM|nr:DUF493 domain-containing protein [Salinisphaera halophila]ROO25098.1 hypothetical protein SAHL_15050 [Salinisphaera halophila YIM 95161]
MSDDRETLLEFPCRFPVKAFGRQGEGFETIVHDLLKPHVPELTHADLSRRESSGGRFVSVTAHITAQSQAQLDAIYAALTASDDIVMAL